MNSRMILTVIGDDRPGLTEALSAAVFAAGGNWLEGHLARLGGKFVGAVLVELAPARLPELRRTLAAQATAGLAVEIAPAGDDSTPHQTVALSLTGQDRPGIVYEASMIIARLGANILELETSAEGSAWSGAPLFRANARLSLPPGLSHADLQSALEELSGDLMVDFARA
ncbi:MAG: glycine cleavage system protein R [Sandaracinobacteroides sp.]